MTTNMYDMYPDYSSATDPIMHRASVAELRRWERDGADDVTDPFDLEDAQRVATAQRAIEPYPYLQRPLGGMVAEAAHVQLEA